MNAWRAAPSSVDADAATIAAAIGDPTRARMLFSLLDGHARTATELALVGNVTPSTASIHLSRLRAHHLVRVQVQGKHRYYSLEGAEVATVLEGLCVLAGRPRAEFTPSTPDHLRAARSCYDHIAGTLGVSLHDRLVVQGWILSDGQGKDAGYDVTPKGARSLAALGLDIDAAHSARRRFAFPCLDWSERRAHVGGALGAALLALALEKKWVTRQRGTRGLQITAVGGRAMLAQFRLRL